MKATYTVRYPAGFSDGSTTEDSLEVLLKRFKGECFNFGVTKTTYLPNRKRLSKHYPGDVIKRTVSMYNLDTKKEKDVMDSILETVSEMMNNTGKH